MKASALLILPLMALALTACELPDIKGLNSVSKKTGELSEKMDVTNDGLHKMSEKMDITNDSTHKMGDKMDITNEAIHKQTLLLALAELNKPENQQNIMPVPTGLMAAGKVFAEEAHTQELIELMYVELKKIEETSPISGIDKDGAPVALTSSEQDQARLKKYANAYSLMIIAAFAQDEKVEEIISQYTLSNRYRETAFTFLALRSFFIREVLLKLSMKVDRGSTETLDNSGKMQEALKWLLKLDRIAKLPYQSKIKADLHMQIDMTGSPMPLPFEEDEKVRQAGIAEMWQIALESAQKGSQLFQQDSAADVSTLVISEKAAQAQAIELFQLHAIEWKH